MLVLSINKILEWCQITTGKGTYTCPVKNINGKLFFKFKNLWHPVEQYLAENAFELVGEGGKILSRKINK